MRILDRRKATAAPGVGEVGVERPNLGLVAATRAAHGDACAKLGYPYPSREADEVIDLTGAGKDGRRFARLAGFYPSDLSATIDRAAALARRCPEALLSDAERALLDLLVWKAVQP